MVKRNTTLSEVAKAAGVSTAAVAKVMYNSKGNTRVSQQKAELIRKIAREMNLAPNASARALRTGKTRTIGFLSGGNAGEIRMRTMVQLTHCLEENGYQILFCPSSRYENTYSLAENLAANCDALVVDLSFVKQDFPACCSGKLLLLTSDERAEKYGHPIIRYGHAEGVAEAMHYLYNKGHRKIAMFSIDWWNNRDNARVRSFAECAAELNLEYAPIEYLADTADAVSIEQISRLLIKHKKATAIFCVCDMLALRVLQAANRLGIRVPQELSVMGFDDINAARLSVPELTTVRQPCLEIARSATNFLMNKLENADCAVEHAIACSLVERSSVDVPGT